MHPLPLETPQEVKEKPAWQRDMDRCRRLAQLMLRDIGRRIDETTPEAREAGKERWDTIFGPKETPASQLVTMFTLFLKLHEFARGMSDHAPASAEHTALAAEDRAILDRYFEQVRTQG